MLPEAALIYTVSGPKSDLQDLMQGGKLFSYCDEKMEDFIPSFSKKEKEKR